MVNKKLKPEDEGGKDVEEEEEKEKHGYEGDFKDGSLQNWLQVLCNAGMALGLSLPPLPPGSRLSRPARGLQVGVRHSNILQCCSVPLCRHHYLGSLLGVAVLGAVSCCNGDIIMVPSRHSPSATSTTSLRYRDTRLWTRTMRRRDTRREARSSTSGPSWSTRNSSPRMRGARASRRRRKRRSLQFKRRCSS